ncbi:hypothetical protein NPIL_597631, partial [Nephila pilipes]
NVSYSRLVANKERVLQQFAFLLDIIKVVGEAMKSAYDLETVILRKQRIYANDAEKRKSRKNSHAIIFIPSRDKNSILADFQFGSRHR